MIRRADLKDAPQMVAMAERFHRATPQLSSLPFSRLRAAQTFMACLASKDHLALALDVNGACGALLVGLSDYPMGPARLAKEIVFWIEPEHRGRWFRKMITHAEDWARSSGASAIGMSCFNDGRTQKVFERAGFEPREIVTFKEL
jgi:GNAT superfamily N-acetyltransferase